MIITIKARSNIQLNGSEPNLYFALLRFMEASKDIMRDDIRHKKLLEAFEGAIKAFDHIGFDVILHDGVEDDESAD
jgi:hypothetical protein